MTDYKSRVRELVEKALSALPQMEGQVLPQLAVETPPKKELGDLAVPLFSLAKVLRMAPAQIAAKVAEAIGGQNAVDGIARVVAEGPYVNIFLDRAVRTREVLEKVSDDGERWGDNNAVSGQSIMVEFSCPNTNKPLHLGHLRNNTLGESVSRILAASGAKVCKVNLINDRGVHICKSMLAYTKFGQGATPESSGKKSDHFVGDFYVRFAKWAKEDPTADEQAREMLRKWEAGDKDIHELWKRMNQWAIGGIQETYKTQGIAFDRYYYESETWVHGRDEVLKGLKKGVFQKEPDGAVVIDLTPQGLDKKVLLRSDGTTLYLTQDIGTAIARHGDWPFDRLVYVVASEQNYHFSVLFKVLEVLGYGWAKNLFHLSYGMVNLPEGKMKSREGTVVDADDLISELSAMALEEIQSKERDRQVADPEKTALAIALGALHYFLLQVSPSKDMIFNPAESLSFNGNTGPYLQYMGARIASMQEKATESIKKSALRCELLDHPMEWELLSLVAEFPDILGQAARNNDPSGLANYLYELAKTFSRYYHDVPILNSPEAELARARLALSQAVGSTLKRGMTLLNVPFLTVM